MQVSSARTNPNTLPRVYTRFRLQVSNPESSLPSPLHLSSPIPQESSLPIQSSSFRGARTDRQAVGKIPVPTLSSALLPGTLTLLGKIPAFSNLKRVRHDAIDIGYTLPEISCRKIPIVKIRGGTPEDDNGGGETVLPRVDMNKRRIDIKRRSKDRVVGRGGGKADGMVAPPTTRATSKQAKPAEKTVKEEIKQLIYPLEGTKVTIRKSYLANLMLTSIPKPLVPRHHTQLSQPQPYPNPPPSQDPPARPISPALSLSSWSSPPTLPNESIIEY